MSSTPKGTLAIPLPTWADIPTFEAGTQGANVSLFNKTPVLGAIRNGGSLVELGDMNESLQALMARTEYLLSLGKTAGQALADPRVGIDRIQSYADLATLSAVTGSRLNDTVLVDGYGLWRADPTSAATIDGISIIARAGGGRWLNIIKVFQLQGGARATRTATQSIPNATTTALTLNTEDFDDANFYSAANDYIEIPTAWGGLYQIHGTASWSGNSTNTVKQFNVSLNGTFMGFSFQDSQNDSGSLQTYKISSIQRLSVGDRLRLTTYQVTGASSSVLNAQLSIVRLGN